MSRAVKNSQAALDWAKKKKEQMEKAKRLREERKMKMQATGGESISANGSTGFSDFNGDRSHPHIGGRVDDGIPDMASNRNNAYGNGYSQNDIPSYAQPKPSNYSQRDRGYGSSNYRPNSNEDISEARQSLMLLKSKMKDKNSFRSQSNANMTTQSQKTIGDGSNGTYRKVFKPSFGGGADNSPVGNGFASHSKPSSRPPINSRLKQKIPQRHGGMTHDTDEDNVAYEPTKRTGSLRSSRITNSTNHSKNSYGGEENGIGNNVPRASKAAKPVHGGMNKAPKMSAASKPTNYGGGIAKARKPPQTSYPDEFGDDAYEKPTNLKPCPSCGRSFNEEALQKHKKVCQKVFQTKAKKFNMQKQRIIDGDHRQALTQAKREERKFGGLKNKTKRSVAMPGSNASKWKKQSSAFRNAMRAARGAKPLNEGYGDFGGGAAEPDNDFIPCPHWGRTFSETAASRHIESCAKRAKEAAMRKGPPKRGPMGKFR